MVFTLVKLLSISPFVLIMPQGHTCGFCGYTFPSAPGLRHHVQRKPACAEAFRIQRMRRLQQINATLGSGITPDSDLVQVLNDPLPAGESSSTTDDATPDPILEDLPDPDPGVFAPAAYALTASPQEQHSEPSRRCPSVEEVEDEGEPWQRTHQEHRTQPYPGAGKPNDLKKYPTVFEQLRDRYGLQGDSAYGPFGDQDSWEIGRFAMKQLSRGGTATLLGLGKVRRPCHLIKEPTYATARSKTLDCHSRAIVSYCE